MPYRSYFELSGNKETGGTIGKFIVGAKQPAPARYALSELGLEVIYKLAEDFDTWKTMFLEANKMLT
jgi:hypothetical protein